MFTVRYPRLRNRFTRMNQCSVVVVSFRLCDVTVSWYMASPVECDGQHKCRISQLVTYYFLMTTYWLQCARLFLRPLRATGGHRGQEHAGIEDRRIVRLASAECGTMHPNCIRTAYRYDCLFSHTTQKLRQERSRTSEHQP